MAELDPELIREIADQVVARLQQRGGRARPGSPQEIRPPAGVCTGDYGKFADRPDLVKGAAKPTSVRPVEKPAASPNSSAGPTPLTGIITASQLEEAVQRDGIVRLATAARLTPLAADYAREHPQAVQRVTGNPAGTAGAASAGSGGRWLLWIDGHCPTVQGIVRDRGADLQVSAAAKSDAGLVQAIRDTSAGVRSGTLVGGVVFVRDAAKATVAANRCGNLRAIVGSCPDAVQRGIESVAANVLIVEYLYTQPDRMTAMIDAMLAATPRPQPVLQRELAELHRRP